MRCLKKCFTLAIVHFACLTSLAGEAEPESNEIERFPFKQGQAIFLPVELFGEKHQFEIDFKARRLPDAVTSETSICLFRVLQEALQNAAKHSGVRHFEVELSQTSREIQLTVADHGAGFDPKSALNGCGLGLTSMQERLRLINGSLSIRSKPGRGTRVYARVPFSSKAKERAAG